MEWYKDEYVISDDRTKVDIAKVIELLSDTYWASNRPPELISKSIENSICFSIFQNKAQIGFGLVVTDYAVFAWIADIIIHPEHRGKGPGKFLISIIVKHPDIPKSSHYFKQKMLIAYMKNPVSKLKNVWKSGNSFISFIKKTIV